MNKINPLESFVLVRNKDLVKPIFLSSPHSGNFYSEEFLSKTKVPLSELRRNEDMYVDELFEDLTKNGFPLLKALYPRIYIDLNRGALELDKSMFKENDINFRIDETKYTRSGIGLIPKISLNGEEIYKSKLLWCDIESRIQDFYNPYHLILKESLDELNNKFETALLVDCHSMPFDRSNDTYKTPEIVIGNNFQDGISMEYGNFLLSSFKKFGFSVKLNDPYSGGFITQYYGSLKKNVKVIQLEIRRDLYMDQDKLIKLSNFKNIQSILSKVINELSNFVITKNEKFYKAAE